MSAIIHINDNNLLIHQSDTITRSQGYAWLSDSDVYFDLDTEHNAVNHCRLEPQQINSRYWQQCAQTSIASNASGMRHAADLIWRHLSELQTSQSLEKVKLVVPSHYQAANLQLLLGICKASNLQINGVINKAVLALSQHVFQTGRYLHVDVQLHQTVCSEVIAELDGTDSGRIVLGEIEVLHEVGLQQMQDALLKAIQERFILSDRFDPLHYAETEQQLFDQLPELAISLRELGKANVSVQYQGRQHATSIDLKQWDAALEAYAQQLDKALIGASVDHRYYDFNGFQALSFSNESQINIALEKANLTAQMRILNALASNQLSDHEDKIIYRTELSIGLNQAPELTELNSSLAHGLVPTSNHTMTEVQGALQANQSNDTPTHLLQAGQAVPLTKARIALEGRQMKLHQSDSSNWNELLSSDKIFIMSDASRYQLQVDDRLGSDLADGVISVIQVLGSSATSNILD